MAVSERGNYDRPRKSAWNFESFDSGLEKRMMESLEKDPAVRKWTKRHGISITWIDRHRRRHSYRPDFLVEYMDGSKALIEVKGAHMVESDSVRRKREAAELWCQRRGMDYSIETIL